MTGARRLAPVALLLVAGCGGAPSTMDPHGPGAGMIAGLWWLMLALSMVVYVLVMGGLAVALFRRRRTEPDPHHIPADRGPRRLLLYGSLATAVVLVVLLGATLPVMRALGAGLWTSEQSVDVIGHQWWWEVHYPQGFVTANEVHIPVGQPVQVHLGSADVIHSFWVPQLQGKMDAIPGRSNTMWLQADQPGEYFSLCAEFCGIQHAHMDLVVVAESPEQFGAWVAAQQRAAAQPTDAPRLRGAQVFARTGCINCHAVRYGQGTIGGSAGPDLTHLASRRLLAAGRLRNTRGELASWLADPQAVKPGNLMPKLDLAGDDLNALLDYLSSLE